MDIFNWKEIINNLIKKVESILTQNKMLIYAGIACLIVWFGASAVINKLSSNVMAPDAQSVRSLDVDKGGMSRTEDEILSLRDVAIKAGIPTNQIVSVLQEKGFKVSSTHDTLEQIARDNRTSSSRLLSVIDAYIKTL